MFRFLFVACVLLAGINPVYAACPLPIPGVSVNDMVSRFSAAGGVRSGAASLQGGAVEG